MINKPEQPYHNSSANQSGKMAAHADITTETGNNIDSQYNKNDKGP